MEIKLTYKNLNSSREAAINAIFTRFLEEAPTAAFTQFDIISFDTVAELNCILAIVKKLGDLDLLETFEITPTNGNNGRRR